MDCAPLNVPRLVAHEDRVKDLWAAMTGDRIVEASGWPAYVTGEKVRNAFAHRAVMVSYEQAVGFIDAAEKVLDHVFNVMEGIGEPSRAALPEELERRLPPDGSR